MNGGRLLQTLKSRGFLQALTASEEEFAHHFSQPRTCYIGFDPTAESLHVGNLLQLLCLRHLQAAGHRPIALIGGATARIGDPSGRSTERPLLDASQVEQNATGIAQCINRVLRTDTVPDQESISPAVMVNNYDWLRHMTLLDFLRDYGKLFRVQQMLNKQSVKSRLSKDDDHEGISFTEFSYQLLQAYDFYHLYQNQQCTLQIGGSDQWGNITAGIQLIHRLVEPTAPSEGPDGEAEKTKKSPTVFGMTLPLITTSDGKKLGKSSSLPGAGIWLDPKKSTPYELYQYFINLPDADAARFLPLFTFLPLEEIQDIQQKHSNALHLRIAQKVLAEELVTLVHGKEEADKAKQITATFFGQSNDTEDSFSLQTLPPNTPQLSVSKDEVLSQRLLNILSQTDLFKTNKEAKRTIADQGLYLNNEVVTDAGYVLNESDILSEGDDQYIVLRKGKKKYCVVRIVQETLPKE